MIKDSSCFGFCLDQNVFEEALILLKMTKKKITLVINENVIGEISKKKIDTT